ncbi:MAG: DegT/DnrJ/EryC1/StrS family aminotransferase [Candidatus Caldatribacteriaceae bacterium]
MRTRENHYIKEIDDFFVTKQFPLYISSSQLHNLKFIFSKQLSASNISVSPNEILDKFVKTHNIRVVKTPSYIDINEWASELDIEDTLIYLSAQAFDCLVLTRDEKFLKVLKERGIHPKDFKKLANEIDKTSIPMLNLTKETLTIYPRIEASIDKVIIKSNFILGEEVTKLEEKITSYIGTKYAIGVSSGTDALVLSLRALAIKRKHEEYWERDDLIVTTPFTFTATGDAILRVGATPLFVDIDRDTYNLNPALLREAMKKYGNRVKGIVPVHLYGRPCNMDEILAVAEENGLFVVEDCAQSFGAQWNGKQTGSFGDTGCFSFFPSKNLGGFGDGGMVTTSDEELAELVRMLLKHGGKDKYNVDHIGYNARLDTLQAAILLAKMEYVEELTERRRKIAEIYTTNLQATGWVKVPTVQEKAYHVYHQYTIGVPEGRRDALQHALKKKGIDTMVYYPVPLHRMKVFKKRCAIGGSLEESERASREVLSLPIEPLMREEDILRVVKAIQEFQDA